MSMLLRPFAGNSTAPTRSRTTVIADVIVLAAVAVIFWLLIKISQGVTQPIHGHQITSTISTAPSELPYYALRSLFRMFVALFFSVVFTFGFATLAARSRRAEKVMLPLLDILQSVPVLSFLSVTITIWLTLFPHSMLGVECAAIFAVFTSQAWNMTFAFYQSLVTQPRELDEAARLLRLTKWQRFWQLDVPSGMIPLVWNGMMSFGGGWFFLTASEAISVNNKTYVVPGIGSYVGVAAERQQLGRVFLAIGVMIVMIIGVNVIFWRPLTAWAERFRIEDSESAQAPRSLTLDLLRRSRVPQLALAAVRPVTRALESGTRVFGLAEHPLQVKAGRRRVIDVVYAVVVIGLICWGLTEMLLYINRTAGLGQFPHTFVLGLATFARVLVLLVFATVVWVPVGVWIGMNPKVNRLAQPVVQVLASFPANFLFPIFTLVLINTGISINIGGIVLMALGAQWYILFNVIAGASAIPNDLREAATNLRLSRVQRWRSVILPSIFAAWVTGAITAAGGAWNASIVAEVVTYGKTTLTATGLGAYIAQSTQHGNFGRMLVGNMVMCIFVVGLNRSFWRRLYRLAETRYSLS